MASQYELAYQAGLAKRAAAKANLASVAAMAPVVDTAAPLKKPEGPGGKGVLQHLFSALTAGEYAITNPISKGIELIHDASTGHRDEIGGDVGALLASPLTGLVSGLFGQENTGNTNSVSQLIDQGVKAAGGDTSTWSKPATIAKAVGGFVGDVAADPLTYLPGPDLFTIGKKVATSIGDVVKAAKAGGAVADAAKQAAKDVGVVAVEEGKKGIGSGGEPKPKSVVESIMEDDAAQTAAARVATAAVDQEVAHADPAVSGILTAQADIAAEKGAAAVGGVIDQTAAKEAKVELPTSTADTALDDIQPEIKAPSEEKVAKAAAPKFTDGLLNPATVDRNTVKGFADLMPANGKIARTKAELAHPHTSGLLPAQKFAEAVEQASTESPRRIDTLMEDAKASGTIDEMDEEGLRQSIANVKLAQSSGDAAALEKARKKLARDLDDTLYEHYSQREYAREDELGENYVAGDINNVPLNQTRHAPTPSEVLAHAQTQVAKAGSDAATYLPADLIERIRSASTSKPQNFYNALMRVRNLLGRNQHAAEVLRKRGGTGRLIGDRAGLNDAMLGALGVTEANAPKLPNLTAAKSAQVQERLAKLAEPGMGLDAQGNPVSLMLNTPQSLVARNWRDVVTESLLKPFFRREGWKKATGKAAEDVRVKTVDEEIAESKRHREFNQFDQAHAAQLYMKDITDSVKKSDEDLAKAAETAKQKGKAVQQYDLAGSGQAQVKRELLESSMNVLQHELERRGVPLTIGLGDEALALSVGEIIGVLNRDPNFASSLLLYNFSTAVPLTNVADALIATLRKDGLVTLGKTRVDARTALTQESTRYTFKGRVKPLPNNMMKPGGHIYNAQRGDALLPQINRMNRAAGLPEGKTTSEALTTNLLGALERNADSFRALIDVNEGMWAAKNKGAIAAITGDDIRAIDAELSRADIVENPGYLIDAAYNGSKRVVDLAEQEKASQVATEAAGVLDEALPTPRQQQEAANISEAAAKKREAGKVDVDTSRYGKLSYGEMNEVMDQEAAAAGDKAAQARLDKLTAAREAERQARIDAAKKALPRAQKALDDAAKTETGANYNALADELESEGGVLDNWDDAPEVRMQGGIWNWTKTAFKNSYGMGPSFEEAERRGGIDASELLRSRTGLKDSALKAFSGLTNSLERFSTGPEGRAKVDAIWRKIQNPSLGALSADEQEIGALINKMLGQVWGVSGREEDALIFNPWIRGSANIEHVNDTIGSFWKRAHKGALADSYRLDLEKAAKEGPDNLLDALANQWRSHDISENSSLAEYFMVHYQALSTVATHIAIVNDFTRTALKQGLASGVKIGEDGRFVLDGAAKAGHVKPSSTAVRGGSVFVKYMPEGVHFDKQAAEWLHTVDWVMRQSFDADSDFNRFVKNTYRPLYDLWKTTMTVTNPSHHFRNMVGDSTLQYLALGTKNLMRAHVISMRLMAGRTYESTDFTRALLEKGLPTDPGTPLFTGSKGAYGIREVEDAIRRRGITPDWHMRENVGDTGAEAGSRVGNLAHAVQTKGPTGAIIKVGGSAAQARDHWGRYAHFMQFVMNNEKRYGSKEALFDAAAASVRKWHPDGSDLTKVEQRLRLIIPFYSWARKAIPLVAEAVLKHPGRVTMFNKASFAVATAAGVNPYSLSDPFPTDQLFPDFMTNLSGGFGPQVEIGGHYYGFSPGVATWDVLGSNFSDLSPTGIGRTVLGQAAPWIKDPVEIATTRSVATGGQINDWSEWLDQQIPGVNVVGRLTGYSPTGTLVGGGLDQNYQYEKGNKDASDRNLSILNWLTGAGGQNMSQQNYINLAEIQKRDAAKQQSRGF